MSDPKNHDQNPFAPVFGAHAKAICNLVSLNNAYSKIMLENAGYVKITNNKALEFLANAVGYNTYKGMLEALATAKVETIKPSHEHIDKAFEKHLGDINADQAHTNLNTLLKTYFDAYQPDLFNHAARVLLYTIGAIKFTHWNDVVKTYLELNLPTPRKFADKTVFSHLLTANALGIITEGLDESLDVMEFEPENNFTLTPIMGDKSATAFLTDFLLSECFKVVSTDTVLYKRNVYYYIAKHLNDPRTLVEYFEKNKNKNTDTKNDLVLKKIGDSVRKKMPKDALAEQLASPDHEAGWVDSCLFGSSEFHKLLYHLTKLTDCVLEQDWTCMTLRPAKVATRAWSDNVVDYYNAMMDHFQGYFSEIVQDTRFDIRKVYINSAGLIMYNTDERLTYRLHGEVDTISANDFCIVANVVLSRRCARELPHSTFTKYMMFYTYYLHRATLTQNKGIDSEVDTWKFSE